jgi:hypothetical protein
MFVYGNEKALELFECTFTELTATASSKSVYEEEKMVHYTACLC